MTALSGTFGKKSFNELSGSVGGMLGGLQIVSPKEALKVIGQFALGKASEALKMMPAAIKKSVQVFKRAAGMPFATRELEAGDNKPARVQHRNSSSAPKMRPPGL